MSLNSEISYNSIENAICLEDTKNGVAKICIPVVTPTLSKTDIVEQTDGPVSVNNIISDINKSDIQPCIVSNYLELPLPNGLLKAKKGDRFSVQFIGGDVSDPVLTQKI